MTPDEWNLLGISGLTIGALVWFVVAVVIGIVEDPPTPMRNRSRLLVVNLLLLVGFWLPLYLLLLPLAGLLRLFLPGRLVNTDYDGSEGDDE